MSGRKSEEQIDEVRTVILGSFRGARMPNLKPGEIVCPVCSQAAIQMPQDRKPGRRYYHPGRLFMCRSLFNVIEVD